MDVVIVLLLVAFMVLTWRAACRWWVSRGGRRWAGHGLGFIVGNFLSVALALPMIPAADEPVTVGGIVYGFVVLGVLGLLEYRKFGSARPTVSSEVSTTVPPKTESDAPPVQEDDQGESNERAGLSFSLRDTAEMILADDVVDQREAELLLQLLDEEDIYRFDPACRELHQVLIASLEDGYLDKDEAFEVKVLLSEICDRPIEREPKPEPKKKAPKAPSKSEVKAARKRSVKAAAAAASRAQSEKARRPGVDEVLAFSYTDSRGKVSDRHIAFRGASQKNGTTYVKGICHDRQAFRTFRADKMDFLCFADTGEMVNSADLAYW